MNTSQHGRREAGHQIFDWVRTLGLHRPQGAWAGGVFAAVAGKLGWDTALVRGLGVIAFFIFFSPMALFYGLAWMFLPDAQGRIHAQQALRGSYPSGFWGAAILGGIGAINVFTPNIVGPFAILLNLVIIGLVAWLLWAIFRSYQKGTDQHGSRGSSPKAPPSEPRSGAGSEGQQPGADGQHADASRREDGKPAWYPKEGPEQAQQGAAPYTSPYPTAGGYGQAHAPATGVKAAPKTKPQEDPRIREEKRRRRLVSFGLLLLAIPLIAAGMWFATTIGLAATNAVVLGLAAVVILLALMHLVSAVRGKKGRGGLLGIFTALMLVVFLVGPSNLQDSSNHVFGNYTTQAGTANTAFANTTMDLRYLADEFTEADAVDFSDDAESAEFLAIRDFHTVVEINNAFANTTVILPDDVFWEIDPGNFLGNVEIRTQEVWESDSGIGATTRDHGPEVAVGTVQLSVANAFGNVVVYDETTYEQEELGIFEEEQTNE
ncbi:PspC domain-containing protein [Nesterenkonia ebinurensis]|uniref:PspC domain-containing protein n=1 Tax=Nesterenkonia ebinurensis TaxID=2608252 RepID=UPI00123D34AE|nr:PspC domain-containing protein [Nesterenkonia ebinurensis]